MTDAVHELFARQLLEIAREVETEERRIKAEILAAAERHDAERVRQIVSRWLKGPVSQVLGDQPTSETSPGVGRPAA